MPKNKIADYTFYKIINVNGDVSLCYVGSTVNMIERRRCHKSRCNNPNDTSYNQKVYQTIREHGGWNEFKMIEIGYAEQLTLTEAHVIEEKYRVELCAELNGQRCFRSNEQHKEHIKNYKKVYYETNKEAISQKSKVYYENNKKAIIESKKAHYENHKIYYENNKEELKAKASKKNTCECGCVLSHGALYSHRKTKKHIDLMNNKNNIDVIHNE